MLQLPPGFNPYYRDVPMEKFIYRATNNGVRIATARDTLAALRSNPSLTLKDWFRLSCLKILLSIQPGRQERTVIKARILYGRWLVDCPVCNGANDVDPNEPVYICTSCGWPESFVEVEFPPDRELIETILLRRAAISARNWNPGETVEMLLRETLEHGG
jgi:hypothetical protein